MNLNELKLPTDEGGNGRDLTDNGIRGEPCVVDVHFKNIEAELVKQISQSKVVVGAVAWLTSKPILQALSNGPQAVSIVVQKEDFLRPDYESDNQWKNELREAYAAIPQPWNRESWSGLEGLSYCGPQALDAIRCIGNHNANKLPAFPRMHNKFVVFCDVSEETEDERRHFKDIVPVGVWTGSFNFTKNAGASLENAVHIHSPRVAEAYYHEWVQMMTLSERLDWDSIWCAPEWRIGS